MFLYPICLIGLLLLSCLIQQFLPSFPGWHHAHILLIPLVVLCGSVTVSPTGMVILAFLGGFLWDAQQVLLVAQGDPLVYDPSPDRLIFGYSIVLYGMMGFLMQGVRPIFQDGKWYVTAVLSGIAIFLYLAIEYLLRSFIIGGYYLDQGIIKQIAATSALTLLLSPFIFWLLFQIADLCGHNLNPRKR